MRSRAFGSSGTRSWKSRWWLLSGRSRRLNLPSGPTWVRTSVT